MLQCVELLNVGLCDNHIVPFSFNAKTVSEFLKHIAEENGLEINMELTRVFGVLINGKKASKNELVYKNDEVVVVPQIAGG